MALLPPCCLLRTGMLRLCIYQRPHKCRRAFTHKMNRPLHHTVSRRQCCRRAFASKMRRHRTLLHLRAAGVIARSPRNALLAVPLCICTSTKHDTQSRMARTRQRPQRSYISCHCKVIFTNTNYEGAHKAASTTPTVIQCNIPAGLCGPPGETHTPPHFLASLVHPAFVQPFRGHFWSCPTELSTCKTDTSSFSGLTFLPRFRQTLS